MEYAIKIIKLVLKMTLDLKTIFLCPKKETISEMIYPKQKAISVATKYEIKRELKTNDNKDITPHKENLINLLILSCKIFIIRKELTLNSLIKC